jgi:hypothetical protein
VVTRVGTASKRLRAGRIACGAPGADKTGDCYFDDRVEWSVVQTEVWKSSNSINDVNYGLYQKMATLGYT